ncbi:MAG: TIGR01777 family protein [Parachlamydiaceae bacterium]|nr:TIGR01777 family protein [Parachlamydiaceae bacterium]
MKILIVGASGLIGKALEKLLVNEGHNVFVLSRSVSSAQENKIPWDPKRGNLDPSAINGFDAIVNLAGENISTRWNSGRKKLILQSRTATTSLLCSAIGKLAVPPNVLINASAVGFYGSRGEELLDEDSPSGKGFLAQVCRAWEASTHQAKKIGVRVVFLRTGVVFSPEGGALKKMLLPFKFGVGGRIGDGKQYVSWIALNDLIRIISFCLNNPSIEGPVNATAPHPVTNAELTEALGEVLNRPTFMTVPKGAVRWIFGEMGDELLLSSTRAEPKKILEKGFSFELPELKNALDAVGTLN